MRQFAVVASLFLSMAFGAPEAVRADSEEKAFGDWRVEAISPTSARASTDGTMVHGHMFALLTTGGDCGSPVLWIAWSAQGPDKPRVDQFKVGERVQVVISAGKTTSRLELPLVAVQPFTPAITVFALTNVPAPRDLLEALGTADKVQVAIEKPKWLAGDILDQADSFSLDGFGPALRDLSQRCTLMASANSCPGADVSLDAWVGIADRPAEARASYLETLESCVSKKPAMADRVDYVAVDGLQALDSVPEEKRGRWASFIADTLRINAQAGDASSQHNLAAMYNAEPESKLIKVFKQDYGRFVYWTRKAAAQGEPRALFNLAVRLAADDASDGVQPDHATAYIAFLTLKPLIDRHQDQLGGLRPIVDHATQKLERKLGVERVVELKKAAEFFKLSSLAPTGAEPVLGG